MWSGKLKQKMGRRAQAMVEFALTLLIFLVIIFLIIEVARLLYTYVTLQHAARMGARYGVTGEWDPSYVGDPNCQPIPGWEPLRDARTCSIEDEVRGSMTALRIDPSASETDDFFFETVVGTADPDTGDWIRGFGGYPEHPIVVQVRYRVKIITPVLSGIVPNVQLTATAVMVNESFGIPGIAQGPLPQPPFPVIPTFGDTPTPLPPPTETPLPSDTPPPTYTPSPTPCPPRFVDPPVLGFLNVRIGGEANTHVEIRDLTTGAIIGQGTLEGSGYCGGVATIPVSPALVAGRTLVVLSEHGAGSAVVLGGTPTLTPSDTPSPEPTNTLIPTNTLPPSQTPVPSATPSYFYFAVTPTCGPVGTNTVTIHGANWPTDEGFIRIRVDGVTQHIINPPTAEWDVTLDITFSPVPMHAVTVATVSGTYSMEYFYTPCAGAPTPGPSPTNTPSPGPTQAPVFARYVNVGHPDLCGDVIFDGVTWEANQAYNATDGWGFAPGGDPAWTGNTGTDVRDRDGVTFLSPEGQRLYRCRGAGATIDGAPSEFTYWFDVPNGQYTVMLGFQEPMTSSDVRQFNVEIEGNVVRRNWDMASEAGGYTRRLDLVFTTVVSDGRLEIHFYPRSGGPASIVKIPVVSAIAVIQPAPPPLPGTPSATPSRTPTPSNTPSPTNTPTPPDLVIESIQPVTPDPQQAFAAVDFDVVVRNNGGAAATDLFWVDLYVDPPTPVGQSIPSAYSVDFAGISGLAGGATQTLRLTVPYFATTGRHNVYAMADTTNRIPEDDETNNVGGPSAVRVENPGGVTPTATIPPTNTPSGSTTGSISGHTWIYAGGSWQVPTGRVEIVVKQGTTVVARTQSASDGSYIVTNLPPGTYTVEGVANVDGSLYYDARAGVVVVSGMTTPNADLFLMKVIP